jgi:parallel beta-helix repeat protein
MRQPAALFPIVLALGAMMLAPGAGAQPTAITACQTISQPGPYVVANDIESFEANACLTITTDRVTIDLAGFSVGGRNSGIRAIISSGFLQGITVRNGSVFSRFGSALDLEEADGSIVEGVHALLVSLVPGAGILAHGIVRGNTFVGPPHGAGVGISAFGVVTDNYVSGLSEGTGIVASGTVRGNTAMNNAIGIVVSAGSTAIGNTATGNRDAGIKADCPSNLTDNTAVNNGTNLVLNGEGCHNEDNVAP